MKKNQKNGVLIPHSFECGYKNVEVWYDSEMVHKEGHSVGLATLGTHDIYLATPIENQINEETMLQTFWHEACHTIIHSLGEFELTYNERFIDSLASHITQVLLTSKGDLLDTWKQDLKKAAKKEAKKAAKKKSRPKTKSVNE